MKRILRDPITGGELKVYAMRGESDEVWEQGIEGYFIRNLASEHNVDEDEMIRRLQNSDADNPIRYRDEIFWCE